MSVELPAVPYGHGAEILEHVAECVGHNPVFIKLGAECVTLRAECAALRAQCVALPVQGMALAGECVALADECVALADECVALAGECVALAVECVALAGECDALAGLFLAQMAVFLEKQALLPRGPPEMVRMDQPGARMDAGLRMDEPSFPNPNPKKHTMKQPNWFPFAIGEQIVWLRNSKKLIGYAETLSLDPADVTARMLDVDNAIYALETYRGGVSSFPNAAYERIKEILHGSIAGNVIWLTFAAPAGAPAAVAYGCLDRFFTYIVDVVLKSPGYTRAIGLDLRTEAPATPAPAVDAVPDFELRFTAGGKMEVVWPKGVFDGVKLQFDLGGGVIQNDIDLRPNYTLNWLPPAGTSAIIKVRLMYILKGEDTGNWSDWQQWTLTGA